MMIKRIVIIKIANAANRRAAGEITGKGMQATLNLYGRTAFNAVQTATPATMRMLFMEAAKKIMLYTAISNSAQGLLNYGYNAWGWI